MTSASHPEAFPELPFEAWNDTRRTLHRYLQIGGKIRLTNAAPMNHWWHVTYYVSPRGLTTGSIPFGKHTFDITFDFMAHELTVDLSSGERFALSLQDGVPVATFYHRLMDALDHFNVQTRIIDRPFDLEPATPFSQDVEHASYDPEYANRFWRVLVQADRVFQRFRGRFSGKSSPVQLYWHSLDLAMTRFSGKLVELPGNVDPVTREAYSHEVISFGFWAGDPKTPAPHFYSYTAPEPTGLTEQPLEPSSAYWSRAGSGSLALLPYEDVRQATDPDATLLAFLESAYSAGCRTAGWDRGLHDHPKWS
jgi:hypothetical protein